MNNLRDMARLLRMRQFRLLWLAQSASVLGDNIVLVALALFVIERTGSATDLGVVLAGHALALVSFLLIGGVWADRLPRHRVMVVCDLVRFALHALLAVLIFQGNVRIWEVVAIEVLYGIAEAFARPAESGLLPQTVPEQDIQQATAITTMSANVAEFVGPALATALVLGAGAGWAFSLDAATFVLSAAFLLQVRPRRRTEAAGAALASSDQSASPGVRESLREGTREVLARTWVWATLASFCAALFFGLAPWFVLGPAVAREQYGSINVYGFIEAALGVGTIAGALIGIGWKPRHPMRLGMIVIMLWPVSSILFAAGATLLVTVPATVLAGAGIALFNVWWMTALAERIPPDRLSRVTAYDWMLSGLLLPIGYALAGPLAERIGSVNELLIGSGLALLAFIAGMIPRETWSLERLGTGVPVRRPEESPAGAVHRY